MSKLIIEEPPLQVLPSLAVQIGLNESIIIQQFHYWLQTSKHKHPDKKGVIRSWIYNSVSKWHVQFPFWSEGGLKRILIRLEKSGYLITGNFNKKAYDRTKWYSINYIAIDLIELSISTEGANGKEPKVPIDQHPGSQPIPETTKKLTQENIYNTKVIFIFDYWNSMDVIRHKQMQPKMEKSILKALKVYEEDYIKNSIDNYAAVFKSEKTFWSYKWGLTEFLSNAIEKFGEYESPDEAVYNHLKSEFKLKTNPLQQHNEIMDMIDEGKA